MDSELDLLLGTVVDSLTKLTLVLTLHEMAGGAESPEEIATKVRESPEAVVRALSELADAGLVERFRLGTGRLTMYGPTEDEHVRALLDLLRARYHGGPRSRGRMVRRILRVGAEPSEGAQEY